MPLSEEELRLLEQMERALVEEDPKLASTLRGTSFLRAARRRAIIAGVVFVIGVAVLMTGVILTMPAVGIIGFVVMLLSATVAVSSLRSPAATAAQPHARDTRHGGLGVIDGGRRHHTRRPRPQASFMERVEQRWRHRRERGL